MSPQTVAAVRYWDAVSGTCGKGAPSKTQRRAPSGPVGQALGLRGALSPAFPVLHPSPLPAVFIRFGGRNGHAQHAAPAAFLDCRKNAAMRPPSNPRRSRRQPVSRSEPPEVREDPPHPNWPHYSRRADLAGPIPMYHAATGGLPFAGGNGHSRSSCSDQTSPERPKRSYMSASESRSREVRLHRFAVLLQLRYCPASALSPRPPSRGSLA